MRKGKSWWRRKQKRLVIHGRIKQKMQFKLEETRIRHQAVQEAKQRMQTREKNQTSRQEPKQRILTMVKNPERQ
jgi:hypothetical protein